MFYCIYPKSRTGLPWISMCCHHSCYKTPHQLEFDIHWDQTVESAWLQVQLWELLVFLLKIYDNKVSIARFDCLLCISPYSKLNFVFLVGFPVMRIWSHLSQHVCVLDIQRIYGQWDQTTFDCSVIFGIAKSTKNVQVLAVTWNCTAIRRSWNRALYNVADC